jgi:hypothetical protein
VIFGITNNGNAASALRDRIALGDRIGGVIRTFGLNVGTNLANDAADIELGEDNDGINVGECGNNFGALLLRHNRTPFTFKGANRIVRVNGHNELSAERFGSSQIPNMTNVQQVEIAVGKRDAFARSTPFIHTLAKFRPAQNFIVSTQ